ncbi:MAG: hypothetical protein MUF31_10425 [Akkermansiaceae bacterium]|nr:hypothetical protein [Akkermansiaceae bacterium]
MLGSWFPSCRDRFTAADFDFLIRLLAPDGDAVALSKLWEDPEALREILDLPGIFRALLEDGGPLAVSPPFYFYVLVRHAFVEAGITDAGLADYVAGVLCERVGVAPADALRGIPGGLVHAVDFVAILESARGRVRFHVQLAAGHQFLVLTGLFPAYLEKRRDRCGAPGVDFYEGFARRVFLEASQNRDAPRDTPRRLLEDLSECLPAARRSLNRLAGDWVFLGD